jgi:uroporphyrinogen-III synthase
MRWGSPTSCCTCSTLRRSSCAGPKPTAALRSRNVRIDLAASDPFTTVEVLAEMDLTALLGKRVVVQRYGETNTELQETIEDHGGHVIEVVLYRWSLPEDCDPLVRLIDALERDDIDVVAFTSASQANNLFTVAENEGKRDSLRASLHRTVVASIGPVCTAALNKLGVTVAIEARPPKLGPLVTAINDAMNSTQERS